MQPDPRPDPRPDLTRNAAGTSVPPRAPRRPGPPAATLQQRPVARLEHLEPLEHLETHPARRAAPPGTVARLLAALSLPRVRWRGVALLLPLLALLLAAGCTTATPQRFGGAPGAPGAPCATLHVRNWTPEDARVRQLDSGRLLATVYSMQRRTVQLCALHGWVPAFRARAIGGRWDRRTWETLPALAPGDRLRLDIARPLRLLPIIP